MTDTWQRITVVCLNRCQSRTQLLLVCLAHLKRTISSNSSPLKRGWYAAESVLRNSTAGKGQQSLALQERPQGQQQEPGRHFRAQGPLLSCWGSCREIRMNSTAEQRWTQWKGTTLRPALPHRIAGTLERCSAFWTHLFVVSHLATWSLDLES